MRGFRLGRRQLLRALPLHLGYALLFGAVGGALLYWLQLIPLGGVWRYALLVPLAAVYTNAAILPLAIPGKHWSFAFVGAMMLVLLLVAGGILSQLFVFQHSRVAGSAGILRAVQVITVLSILTGADIGLFYGVLAGQRGALLVGAALGGAVGYLLGLLSTNVISSATGSFDVLIYSGPLQFAWQGALANGAWHLGGGLGAALGASHPPTPQLAPGPKTPAAPRRP